MSKQLQFKVVLRRGEPLIVDSFAGGGGASCGIGMALGREPDIAINHDPEAIEMHRVNHPQTQHFPSDIREVDPLEATGGHPVGLAWYSPDCKHFSKAKTGKPRDKNIRGLAWIVVHWINRLKPNDTHPLVIMLENVEEFQTWCPLITEKMAERLGDPELEGFPSKWRPGWFFRCFVGALRRRGYTVEMREMRACDYGAPTIRKRFFLVARRDGQPIVFPLPTHGRPTSKEVKSGKLKPWRTAAECIDWSIPCPSIFLSKEKGRELGVRRPLADATLRRIAKGVMRFIVQAEKPFVVPKIHADKLVASPFLTECANASSNRVFSIEDPLRTQCAEVKGGHFALVTAFLAKHYGGVTGIPVTEPAGTVTSVDSHALVTAFVSKFRGTNIGHPATDPLHTVSAGGFHFAAVHAFLVKYYGNEKDPVSITDPLHTVTTRDRFALVTVRVAGETYAIYDIGMRMLRPRELYRAQGFPESYYIGEGAPLSLSKKAQVRMCGNSVSPPISMALAAANVPHLVATPKKKAV